MDKNKNIIETSNVSGSQKYNKIDKLTYYLKSQNADIGCKLRKKIVAYFPNQKLLSQRFHSIF